jgi:hypothetical protein
MEQNVNFDQDLLDLFSNVIDDGNERMILELLFTKRNVEELIDELVEMLEPMKND